MGEIRNCKGLGCQQVLTETFLLEPDFESGAGAGLVRGGAGLARQGRAGCVKMHTVGKMVLQGFRRMQAQLESIERASEGCI